MKKICSIILVIALMLSVAACTPAESKPADEVAPEISGVRASLTATVNESINLLEGVSAVDDVDGDITANIQITVMPELAVTDGVITPTETGTYEIAYKITDAAGNEGAMYAELTVTPALAEMVSEKVYAFDTVSDNGYATYFNEAVQGTASLVKGNYQINVTEGSGTDWHIKFEKTITTTPGADYKLQYSFVSSVAGTVMLNGKAIEIVAGANTVENTILAVEGEELYTELQLGMLPAPFVVDITQVTVEEISGADVFTDITPEGFLFNAEGQAWEQFNGNSEGSFSTTETSATLNITKPGESNDGHGGVWESRIYVKAGMDLKAGKKYKISIDVESQNRYECMEICYNSGDVEKGVGALYGQTIEAGEKKTFSITVSLEENKDNLIILLQAGQLPADVSSNTVTVSNLVIEEVSGDKTTVSEDYVFTPEGIATYNDAGAGCEGFLYAQDGKLVYEMTKIGLTDWHNKMMIEDVILEADKYYTIRFTAKADKDISCAFFLAVQSTEWDPRVSETIDFTTEEKTYELKMDKTLAIDMPFQILWQFGSEANQAMGGAVIEFSNIEILSQEVE